MKKRTTVKKLQLRRETLANLVGGLVPFDGVETTSIYEDTVYSKREDCAPLSAKCPSADTRCTACVA